MSFANREAFLQPIELKTDEFDTRLGKVRMRELSGTRMTELRNWSRPNGELDEERQKDSMLKLLTMTIVGDDDKPFLEESDFDTIKAYPTKLQETLITKAATLNGLISEGDEVTDDLRGKSSS